jgi:hypothetical protein
MKLKIKITKELIDISKSLKMQEMIPEEEEEELEKIDRLPKTLKLLLNNHNKFQQLDLNEYLRYFY